MLGHRYRESVAEEDGRRAKAAGRTTRAFVQALHLPSRQKRWDILASWTPVFHSQRTDEGVIVTWKDAVTSSPRDDRSSYP